MEGKHTIRQTRLKIRLVKTEKTMMVMNNLGMNRRTLLRESQTSGQLGAGMETDHLTEEIWPWPAETKREDHWKE